MAHLRTYSLSLEGLNSLHVPRNVVGDGLEVPQELLSFINDSLVLEYRTVVRKVDGGRLGVELCVDPLRVAVTFTERLKSGDGLWTYKGSASVCIEHKT